MQVGRAREGWGPLGVDRDVDVDFYPHRVESQPLRRAVHNFSLEAIDTVDDLCVVGRRRGFIGALAAELDFGNRLKILSQT